MALKTVGNIIKLVSDSFIILGFPAPNINLHTNLENYGFVFALFLKNIPIHQKYKYNFKLMFIKYFYKKY